MNNLKHIDHGRYTIDHIKYINYNLKNPNVKEKEYEVDDSVAIENEKVAYIQVIHDRNPIIYVTTLKMFCPFGLSKKVVYENEEFNLLQAALNIEQGIDDLRYNKIVIATDADVDGMHIRLLLITFFLQFFPELIKEGHVYILETPLFRVRNKKKTYYCYTDKERKDAIAAIGTNAEITRFKGLGEISPNEFKHFIGDDMRLDPVILGKESKIQDLLKYFMGKNTKERQDFIIENLRIEEEIIDA